MNYVDRFDLAAADRKSDQFLREKARDGLKSIFGELAASEALTRALVAERIEKRDQAHFWLDVYFALCSDPGDGIVPEIVKI